MSTASNLEKTQAHTQDDPIWQAKVHLAAALRLAVLHDFDEGIDNHSLSLYRAVKTNS